MKRILNGVLVSSLLALSMSGLFAQGSSEPASGKGGQASQPTTIVFYTWEDAPHRALVEEFNRTHTDIQVDAKILPSSDFNVKLATLLSGHAEMDCFMEKTSPDVYTQYANGFIEPLNKYIKAAGGSNPAVEAYKTFSYIGNDVVDIPWRGGAVYTYYNKKVFEKAGIPTPDTYVEKGEWTWEKFEEVAQAIHQADPNLLGALFNSTASNHELIASQAGDQILTEDGKIDNVGNVTKQLAIRKRLEATGAMPSLVNMKVTKTHYSKPFYDGNLGMLIIGEWFPGLINSGAKNGLLNGFTTDDYGITRMPCDEPEYVTHGHPTFSCITSYSKKKEAAFEFITWMASEAGAKVTASLGVLPALTDSEVEKTIAENIPDARSVQYFLEPKSVKMAGYNKYGSRVESVLSTLMEDYLLGNLTDSEFESKFKAELENIVQTSY